VRLSDPTIPRLLSENRPLVGSKSVLSTFCASNGHSVVAPMEGQLLVDPSERPLAFSFQDGQFSLATENAFRIP
jgi:hypothetical protein